MLHAPTNEASTEDKQSFYNELVGVLKDIPRHDVLCLLGDLNAKIGNDYTFCPEVHEKHGIGEQNDNGELLIDFSLLHDLVIGGSLFPHPDIHKYSWTSPDGRIRNQIDHCLINRKWRSSLQDVRAYRGADVGSDHNLMIATILLKLRKHTRKCPLPAKPLFASTKLKDNEMKTLLSVELSNKFETLVLHEDADCETIWESMKSCYQEVAESTIGYRPKLNDEWPSQKTWDLIAERKKIKSQLLDAHVPSVQIHKQNDYRRIDKEIKKSARTDKRNYIEQKIIQAEDAAKRGDSRTLYKLTNETIGKKLIQDGPVRNSDDVLITERSAIDETWANHFEKLLNRPPPDELLYVPSIAFFKLGINT
ncbi:uncharacterized protein LOC136034323 [Artemia franciscana]|uniref:uncharacterized protein LOC136034323 n=1 Tax=Artemia franciscana TaxID=6661 RepID=UPI0032DA9B99